MNSEKSEARLDVVKTDHGWIVADSGRASQIPHLTLAGAQNQAIKRARALLALGEHPTIYLWEGSHARVVSFEPTDT